MTRNLLKKYYLHKKVAKLHLKQKNITPRFHVNSDLELKKILYKDNETNILKLFLENIRSTDTIFDIGANIGLYTLPCAMKANKGRIIAFEPVPIWFNRLQENISLNSINNVQAYNLGLHRKKQQLKITIKNISGSGMASIVDNYGDSIHLKNREDVYAQFVEGDTFISENKIPLPNLIKIDVEGAELDVLIGLRKTISQQCCRLILCEVHPKIINYPNKIENILIESEYKIEIIGRREPEYYILALKN